MRHSFEKYYISQNKTRTIWLSPVFICHGGSRSRFVLPKDRSQDFTWLCRKACLSKRSGISHSPLEYRFVKRREILPLALPRPGRRTALDMTKATYREID